MVQNRVTVWPGMRLPLPVVPRFPNCGLWESESGVWLRASSQDFVEPTGKDGGFRLVLDADVGEELYLDLYLQGPDRTDLEEPAAVAAFVRRYGWVRAPRWHEIVEESASQILRPDVLREAQEDDALLAAERAKHPPQWVELLGDMEESYLESPRQVARTLGIVRELTTLYLLLTGALSEDEAGERLAGGSIDPEVVTEESSVRWAFRRLIDVGLRPFHVTVLVGEPAKDEPTPWSEPLDLFNVLCLSLANDIADQADYKRCASETCGRLFTRHRGRAKQGKYHMTGVKFCCVECARAQKQREYRRRQKAEKQRRQRPAGQKEASRALRDDKEGQ